MHTIAFARRFLCFSILLASATQCGGAITVLFQPGSAAAGPFPSNSFTQADPAQKTGIRVNLPQPAGCPSALSGCTNTALLNQLDGFSVNPRVTVCFSGAINPDTLQSALSFADVDGGALTAANQLFYDPAANCAYAKPDHVLAQQGHYLLLVSGNIQDTGGQPISADPAFENCLQNVSNSYCASLSAAVARYSQAHPGTLISASLFTTMSATDWLEKARDIAKSGPAIAIPAGLVSSYNLSTVKSITYIPQDNSGKNTTIPIPLDALSGVEKIAFGVYLSPNFVNTSGPATGTIAVTPTNSPIQRPVPLPGIGQFLSGYAPVSYHVFLPPASGRPASGFPVVIYGHGLSDNQFGAPTFIASTLAKQGFATLAIEIPGHGFGPLSYVNVVNQFGSNMVLTPGRGVLSPGSKTYGATDGCIVGGPIGVRDCARQTAVDLSALAHTIQGTRGLGLNLDPAKIFYVGQSFGGTYGTLFHAIEPAVSHAVLNGDGATTVDVSRLAITARPLGSLYLATRNPPLLNVPPPTNAPPEDYFHDAFNDNYPFRGRVTVNNIPGAPQIQAAFEEADWLGMLGDPLAFAPHLKTSPLAGVGAKQTLFQFGFGDLEIPNPTESAVVRAADSLDTTWFFHFEQAVQTHPELLGVTQPGSPLPVLPHRFLSNPTIFGVPSEQSVAIAAQKQAALFFAGQANPDPNPLLEGVFAGSKLFEVAPQAVPDTLIFLQLPK